MAQYISGGNPLEPNQYIQPFRPAGYPQECATNQPMGPTGVQPTYQSLMEMTQMFLQASQQLLGLWSSFAQQPPPGTQAAPPPPPQQCQCQNQPFANYQVGAGGSVSFTFYGGSSSPQEAPPTSYGSQFQGPFQAPPATGYGPEASYGYAPGPTGYATESPFPAYGQGPAATGYGTEGGFGSGYGTAVPSFGYAPNQGYGTEFPSFGYAPNQGAPASGYATEFPSFGYAPNQGAPGSGYVTPTGGNVGSAGNVGTGGSAGTGYSTAPPAPVVTPPVYETPPVNVPTTGETPNAGTPTPPVVVTPPVYETPPVIVPTTGETPNAGTPTPPVVVTPPVYETPPVIVPTTGETPNAGTPTPPVYETPPATVPTTGDTPNQGGVPNAGGSPNQSGGTPTTGDTPNQGGVPNAGGSPNQSGGTPTTGDTPNEGGVPNAGGSPNQSGGTPTTGDTPNEGGVPNAGGSPNQSGGTPTTGDTPNEGGVPNAGGSPNQSGGTPTTGDVPNGAGGVGDDGGSSEVPTTGTADPTLSDTAPKTRVTKPTDLSPEVASQVLAQARSGVLNSLFGAEGDTVSIEGVSGPGNLAVGTVVDIKNAQGVTKTRTLTADDVNAVNFRTNLIHASELASPSWDFTEKIVEMPKNTLQPPEVRTVSQNGAEVQETVLARDKNWEVVERTGSDNKPFQYLQMKEGSKASEALDDIFANKDKFVFDCATPMHLLNLKAELDTVGPDAFNSANKQLVLHSHFVGNEAGHNFDSGFNLNVTYAQPGNSSGAIPGVEFARYDGSADKLTPGEWRYFQNYGDTSGGASQGTNRIYLGPGEKGQSLWWTIGDGIQSTTLGNPPRMPAGDHVETLTTLQGAPPLATLNSIETTGRA